LPPESPAPPTCHRCRCCCSPACLPADDVQVLSVRRVARRTLSANVTATLGVDVPAGATDEDISAALEVERLSADDPIAMLSSDPDRFFGRTTKAGQAARCIVCTAFAMLHSGPPAARARCCCSPSLMCLQLQRICSPPAACLLCCRLWTSRWRALCKQPRKAAPAAPTWDCELLPAAAAPDR
jgi:hypothetical protein